MQHPAHDEVILMEEALAAIRRAMADQEAGQMTSTVTSQAAEAGLLSRDATAANRLCIQHVDGNCEAAPAIAGRCGSRNTSPHAQVVVGRKLAPRSRADGAGRNRTGYSRMLTTVRAALGRANSGHQQRQPNVA
jgi:hypothetical protein